MCKYFCQILRMIHGYNHQRLHLEYHKALYYSLHFYQLINSFPQSAWWWRAYFSLILPNKASDVNILYEYLSFCEFTRRTFV